MEPLKVQATGGTPFYAKEDSEKDHNTAVYSLVQTDPPTAVLRRSANFSLFLGFTRNYDASSDVVRITFSFGPDPRETKGTKAVVIARVKKTQVSFPEDENKWDARVTDNRVKSHLVVEVHIPSTVPVGVWNCSVQTNIRKNRENTINYEIPEKIYILFNPWSPKDAVYMENEAERNEYILNTTGKIWCGTHKNPEPRYWRFDQFDDIALPAAVFLLDKSNLLHSKRGDPTLVTRAISAIVNSDDDDGLLVGRYDGNYEDGISPHLWNNSATILYQYLQSKGTPVKYGQCWVYSAVIVTICRALGIPCRSTTNYVSSHDTESPYIGRYHDNLVENGPQRLDDLCWSFHAWNDVWIARTDFASREYDGWHVIDGTPLTQNEGLKRCGPAPVAAVKSGNIAPAFDTRLVFYEINADIMHFIQDEESTTGYRKITTNRYRAGQKIVTKKLGPTEDFEGNSDLLDVTLVYKYPAGSKEETQAIARAIRDSPTVEPVQSNQTEDVFFDLVDTKPVLYGEGFDVDVTVRNKSRQVRTIDYVLTASSIYYTGKLNSVIKRIPSDVTIKPGDEKNLVMHVPPKKYLSELVDHGIIKLLAYAKVRETGQAWSEEDDYSLIAPDMSIAVSPAVTNLGDTITVTFTFHNPLNEPLTDCYYTVLAPTKENVTAARLDNVRPYEIVNESVDLVVSREGKGKVVVTFTSKQIPHITASTVIQVVL